MSPCQTLATNAKGGVPWTSVPEIVGWSLYKVRYSSLAWSEQHRRRSRRNREGVDVGGLRLIRDQVLPLDLAVKPAEATKEEQNGEGYL